MRLKDSKGGYYNIPISDDEVRVSHFLKALDGCDLFEALTGIASNAAISYDTEQLLSGLLWWVPEFSFSVEPEPIEGCIPEEMEYNRYSHCLIMASRPRSEYLPFFYAAYTYHGAWDLKAVNALAEQVPNMHHSISGQMLWIEQQVGAMQQKWSKLLSKPPTAKQVSAGVHNFEPFGDFGAILNLAGNDLERAERLRNRSFSEILTALYYFRIFDEYQTKLNT